MPRLAIAAAAAVLALAGSLSACPLTLEPLVIVGESYGDMPGVVSQTLGESQINNSGQWVTRVAGTNSAGEYLGVFVIAHDGIRFDPFTPIPYEGDLTFNYPPSSPRYSSINNHGQIATTFRGLVSDPDGNVVGTRSMIAVDGSPVIRTGDTTPSADDLEAFRVEIHSATDAYIRSTPEDRLSARRDFVVWGGDRRPLVPAQVILRTQTHIYHHMGQVTAMCRLLGHPTPPGMDFPLA